MSALPLLAACAVAGTMGAVSAFAQVPAAGVIVVGDSAELNAALSSARPGQRIELKPASYAGGLYFRGLRGEAGKPVVIAASDPAKPPRIEGGATGIHLSNPAFVELHNLTITGWRINGVSLDDGGAFSPAPRGIVLKGLRISGSGARGNHDAIKLSGVTGFRVEDCDVRGWGSGSGAGLTWSDATTASSSAACFPTAPACRRRAAAGADERREQPRRGEAVPF